MPELDTIAVKGFKSIASIEKLKLSAINVLIGPNGSGKSNFIGVFSFLNAIREGQLQDYVARAGGADKVLHFGSKVTQAIEIHISFQEEVNQYQIRLEATETDQLYPSAETAYFWGQRTLSREAYARPLTPLEPRPASAIPTAGARLALSVSIWEVGDFTTFMTRVPARR